MKIRHWNKQADRQRVYDNYLYKKTKIKGQKRKSQRCKNWWNWKSFLNKAFMLSFRPKWPKNSLKNGHTSEWVTDSSEGQKVKRASLLNMSNSIKADFVWWTIVYICFFLSLKGESEIAGFYQSLAAYEAIYLDDTLTFSLTCCLHCGKVVCTLNNFDQMFYGFYIFYMLIKLIYPK